jgi:hypothetical protein
MVRGRDVWGGVKRICVGVGGGWRGVKMKRYGQRKIEITFLLFWLDSVEKLVSLLGCPRRIHSPLPSLLVWLTFVLFLTKPSGAGPIMYSHNLANAPLLGLSPNPALPCTVRSSKFEMSLDQSTMFEYHSLFSSRVIAHIEF